MKTVHILNPFESPFGGSELRALDLFERLKDQAEVRLWAMAEVPAELAARGPITRVDVARGVVPRGGTLVVVGAYFQAEVLFHLATPERLIYIFNTPSPNLFKMRLKLARERTGIEPEIVYASEGGARLVGIPGRIEPSPINFERFRVRRNRQPGQNARPFTIGRHSRDVPEKHHPEDLALYHAAAARGWHVRLMGGTCLADKMDRTLGGQIECLACGTLPPEDFLAGLDCFFYRVSDDWTEAFGRVVLEAMASGLPVICDHKVGASGLITTGESGFVTTSTEEARTALERLAGDPLLRQAMGEAARRKAESTYSESFTQELRDYYLA